jgi:phosphoserine phosphatase
MDTTATFVAPDSDKLTQDSLDELALFFPGEIEQDWLHRNKAADIHYPASMPDGLEQALRDFAENRGWDVIIQRRATRRKKLLLADMDSTIVTSETLDDLAAKLGIADKIAPITARAMAGELDFSAALSERVALLKGIPASTMNDVLDEMELSPGAAALVKTMTAHGATCVLVSGGFTSVTSVIAERCGFAHNHGNVLELDGDTFAGTCASPILDKAAKLTYLREYTQKLGIGMDMAVTVGDGANDIPMLDAAGLGVGYHPKPAVRAAIPDAIIHTDLKTLLYAQGYRPVDFKGE